ncbi:hypothetical protein [Streptomyces pacificus]|uniref:Uncharacterized protein n=1 Tax=Streptomyces pacificus TaxID=2705029 RepID=A0A6A0B0Y0_9ACTN|nr:hypothetical protein [Streptomyces pacificus]GFH38899.1 hypothetical protein SCWH03_51620 [Streptomyces pacificus]
MNNAHTIHLPAIPDYVPRSALRTICEALGLPASDVRALDISLDSVMVALHARGETGHKLAAGDDAVVVTVSIPVR